MQPIQDKQLDKLFRDKFQNAELMPREDLWKSIAPKVTKPRKKSTFPFMWMAAASLATVLTFGLFNKQEKIKLFNPNFEVDAPYYDELELDVLEGEIMESEEKVDMPTQVISQSTSTSQLGKKQTLDPIRVKEMPQATLQEQNLQKVEAPRNDIPQIVETNTVVFANGGGELEAINEVENIPVVKQDRIRNVGDLVNFVVDKLDKREQKAIKFRTDDDESSIVSFNLGPFKFNQKKK